MDDAVSAVRTNEYGSTYINGSATAVLGNVQNLHVLHREFDRKQALRNALDYSGQHSRAIQIGSTVTSLKSFEWIWNTSFANWLRSPANLFWINGKPGSGKSTLVHHLARAYKTKEVLETNGRQFQIVEFYFDFRAGKDTPNSEIGLLRAWTRQICNHFEDVETHLANRHLDEISKSISATRLYDILCESLRNLPTQICGFVDGLDEYEGDHLYLGQMFLNLVSRTPIKLILASRPEVVLERLFQSIPTVVMQDYNQAAVLAYIDYAISCAPVTLRDIRAAIDFDMRTLLAGRAQGVIIWVRLAVEAMILAANEGASQDELMDILDQLPEELHEMYERVLSKRSSNMTSELVLILWTVNKLGGSIEIPVLYGLWQYFRTSKAYGGDQFILIFENEKDFAERIRVLLGPFVEVTLKFEKDHRNLGSRHSRLQSRLSRDLYREIPYGSRWPSLSYDHGSLRESKIARLLHKTLQPFLQGSRFVQSSLPEYVRNAPLDFFKCGLHVDLIRSATAELHCDASIISRMEFEEGESQYWPVAIATEKVVQSLVRDTGWQTHPWALTWSLQRFYSFRGSKTTLAWSSETLTFRKDVLCSPFVLLEVASDCGLQFTSQLIEDSWYLDIKLAILMEWLEYLQQSSHWRAPPSQSHWNRLLRWYLKDVCAARKRVEPTCLEYLAAQCSKIDVGVLAALIPSKLPDYVIGGSRRSVVWPALPSSMSRMSLILPSRGIAESSTQTTCRCNNDRYILLWWIRTCIWALQQNSERISKAYYNLVVTLQIILNSDLDLNITCPEHGSAFHVATSKGSDSAGESMVVLLARLNIDPAVSHRSRKNNSMKEKPIMDTPVQDISTKDTSTEQKAPKPKRGSLTFWKKHKPVSSEGAESVDTKQSQSRNMSFDARLKQTNAPLAQSPQRVTPPWIDELFAHYENHGSWPNPDTLDALTREHKLGPPATWQVIRVTEGESERLVVSADPDQQADVNALRLK